ncbi:MAG: hypothetical protein A2499_03715 [Stygiobacter sp. RIFOXYC12_FULL_38_8]|jgi:enoyl-CoA hydratase/carnithine racemase|nr:enoyl-CoA hydratase/isomerase family protein [Bacteroidota bacterium]MBX2975954.1 enoyl-CoA hydratase/isomerase family protein [Ignavibacteriaceae bacterium]OGU66466.1 MAG: hypothetical protein A2X62_00985 [Stygiobacter sp. GWC2_38_9]OGU81316.1 MAG: hypothetical protein A2279_13005 [Stygiobacter sp. RIFOXYA12_FULL_38_9]OGV06830.1 MAG: hypothetical protein A2299_02875 [Stygiobacter sp. RIFOXYB2_FULL_37_11]OGV10495.1 MAG: hypothetical protein A2237_01165 [Stygiobacter sp. RIFOXYA2_FULL_38_8]
MKKELKLEFEFEDIKSYKIGSLVILEPKTDGFRTLLNVDESFELIEWIDLAGKDKSVKGILFIGNENCFCDKAYAKHLATLTGEYINPEEPRLVKKIIDDKKRSIQINMLNNYIRKIIETPKMIFIAITSCVVSPFFGLSLAADYRIASPNLLIHLNSKEYGLHPSGGVPFFMIKQVGLSKTQEILYSQRYMDALTAKLLGIINHLTSPNNYRSDAISHAIEMLESTSYEYFFYTKQLINHKILNEFQVYTELESQMDLH